MDFKGPARDACHNKNNLIFIFTEWILRDLVEMHATTKITQFLFLPNKKEKP
jgi:hypothetical protein